MEGRFSSLCTPGALARCSGCCFLPAQYWRIHKVEGVKKTFFLTEPSTSLLSSSIVIWCLLVMFFTSASVWASSSSSSSNSITAPSSLSGLSEPSSSGSKISSGLDSTCSFLSSSKRNKTRKNHLVCFFLNLFNQQQSSATDTTEVWNTTHLRGSLSV